jgi:Pentapeptide repeats (8 copies)
MRIAKIVFWMLAVVAAVAAGVFVIWIGPNVLTRAGTADIDPADRLRITNSVRGTLLASLAGVGALGGLVYTGRSFRLSRDGQITDRYMRAVEQLASENVEMRAGAVYSLERIMKNSPSDRRVIIELLAAFVRGRAPGYDISVGGAMDASGQSEAEFNEFYRGLFRNPYLIDREYDIQAALTVLGRNQQPKGSNPVTLVGVNLIRGYFSNASFPYAHFGESHLEIAVFQNSDLRGAIFWDTNLTGAYLTNADLRGADLSRAHLRQADLRGADLRDAVLSEADLRGAFADTETRWPTGFDATEAGVTIDDSTGPKPSP